MKTITALKIQVRDKNKVNVFLNNTYFCSLSLETVMKYNLKPNMMVEEAVIEKYQMESEKSLAYDKALKLISTRYKTQKEVEKYLEEKGYLPSTIWYVIKKLLDYNFIDDERYVESYLSHHKEKDGVNKIRQQLLMKGIREEIIESALSKVENQFDEIIKFKEKYMKGKEETRENYMKLYRYLIGKGFKSDEILQVLKGEIKE